MNNPSCWLQVQETKNKTNYITCNNCCSWFSCIVTTVYGCLVQTTVRRTHVVTTVQGTLVITIFHGTLLKITVKGTLVLPTLYTFQNGILRLQIDLHRKKVTFKNYCELTTRANPTKQICLIKRTLETPKKGFKFF